MERITEWCPCCENEVQLEDKFEIQTCPSCGEPISPCSICTHEDYILRKDCSECPLIEEEENE